MSECNPWYDPTEEIKAQTERENVRIKARMKLTHACRKSETFAGPWRYKK